MTIWEIWTNDGIFLALRYSKERAIIAAEGLQGVWQDKRLEIREVEKK